MAQKPPPLPSEIFLRLLRVASLDGRILMIVAGTLAVLHAAAHQGTDALVGCLVAGAGALELHGAGLLRNGERRGLNWLVRSQLLLLATLLIYASLQLAHPNLADLQKTIVTPDLLQALKEVNVAPDHFALLVNSTTYVTLGLVSLIYQGGMAVYYYRRRNSVSLALQEFFAEDDDVFSHD